MSAPAGAAAGFGPCPACHRDHALDAAGHLVAHAVPAQPVSQALCWGGDRRPHLADPAADLFIEPAEAEEAEEAVAVTVGRPTPQPTVASVAAARVKARRSGS